MISGDRTHNQLQLITPVNFSAIKSNVSKDVKGAFFISCTPSAPEDE